MNARTDICVRDYTALQVMPSHLHQDALMSIVVKGTFCEQIGDAERLYTHGHIALFPAGRTHAQRFGPRGARQIIFRPRQEWLGYLIDCGTELDAAPYATAPEFGWLGDRLLAELQNDDALSGLAREGILLEIVARFGRRDSRTKNLPVPRWLRKTREFLGDNACRSLTLSEVARVAGRHETHVAREFRRHFGTSVVGYLRRLRAQRAAHMLAQDRGEIGAIALDCGYCSHSHFTREFKLYYGTTPSRYRSVQRK